MSSIQLIRLLPSDKRWKAFVESITRTSVFHDPAWIELLSECYGYRSYVYALIDEKDKICAGIPMIAVNSFLTGKRWVSIPFTDYCYPLFINPDNLEELTQGLVSKFQEDLHTRFEVRWELPPHPDIQNLASYVQHIVHIDRDVDEIFASFHRTQRQNIRTAEKNDIRIERGEDLEHLRKFYRLHCLTRQRQGVPVQPWHFFELILKRMIEKGLGFILLAYHANECLAAGLFLHGGETLTYKFAASSDNGQDLRPNHLLTWIAMQWGHEKGFKKFDFGRTDICNEGLRTFKNRWGAEEIPLTYSVLSDEPPQPSSGRIEQLMHKVIQNSPLWVCRLSGEILYRHFG